MRVKGWGWWESRSGRGVGGIKVVGQGGGGVGW